MKKMIVFSKILAVMLVVGSSLAFTKGNFFGQGEVYCASNCSSISKIDWKPSSSGSVTDPCENGGNAWGINFFSGGSCDQYSAGTTFVTTAAGSKK